tara:strand:- start:7584 stop:8705 length:1122 start_codon:yes stop_codon:yes gene_type:complete
MPNFKPKNNKKLNINKKNNITLDGKHSEYVNDFNKSKKEIIPKLKDKIKELKLRLINENLPIEKELDIKDEINSLKKEIADIKMKESTYYLDNSKHIFDYFETKKDIAEGKSKTTLLDNFFNINPSTINKSDNEQNHVQQYLTNIDESFINIENFIIQSDICKKCGDGEMIIVESEGILVCNNCSHNVKYLVDSDKPSYKEPPKEICFYAYKRINHFREILAQFQAKESTLIPEHVLENVKLQIKKERLQLSQLTNKKTKEMLKNLGYNKYYEHIPFIKDKLGIKPPIMSPELEELLCNLFIDIQAPYARYCPDDRVNFLNYYYTVYKLCELLEQREFLPFFPMLKDREKRIEQDEIWKKICIELDWEFIPTV